MQNKTQLPCSAPPQKKNPYLTYTEILEKAKQTIFWKSRFVFFLLVCGGGGDCGGGGGGGGDGGGDGGGGDGRFVFFLI